MLVEIAAEKYVADRAARGEITPLTARNLRCMFKSLMACVGPDTPLDEITPTAVEGWLATIGHLASATRRGRHSAVKTFFRWAIIHDLIDRHPMVDIPSPKQPRYLPRAIGVEAVAAILRACPDARARLIVLLMVQEGLRCCEVANLQLGDIDRNHGLMAVKGKGGHERVLPICEEVAAALDAYIEEFPARGGPLLRSYKRPAYGLAADTISGLVGQWFADAGVKRKRHDGRSAHALRHTAATDMLRNGAHVRDVQRALGHAHLTTTEIYLPYAVNGLAQAMSGRRYGRKGDT